MEKIYLTLVSLLRQALGVEKENDLSALNEEEWSCVYQQAWKQSVCGIAYEAVKQLSGKHCPPDDLLFMWTAEAERIKGMNCLLFEEATRMTRLFAHEGHHTVVLKGQANAILYPNPFSRQCGDIDLWVDGGHDTG